MIPDFQLAMLPVLKTMQDGNVYDSNSLRKSMINIFSITLDEQQQKTPNGKQVLFFNRIAWSISYLRTSGLIFSPERGRYKISELGKKILLNPPNKITIKFLKEISPEENNKDSKETELINSTTHIIQTPDEMMEEGFNQINTELSKLLLESLEEISSYKFEQIVIDLLIKMGYGGSDFANGEVTKKTGDEGIDGIIKEDKLGLDKIYVQAKKWKQDLNKIGRPEIQKFVGALDGKRAKKGIFITTAFFSQEAIDYTDRTNFDIVLIDGEKLTKLMIPGFKFEVREEDPKKPLAESGSLVISWDDY